MVLDRKAGGKTHVILEGKDTGVAIHGDAAASGGLCQSRKY